MLRKTRVQRALSLGTSRRKKGNVALLSSVHQAKKQLNFENGQLKHQQGGLHEPKRLRWRFSKVERKYIQEEQPNYFHFYSQNMGLVNRMDQTVVKSRTGALLEYNICQYSSNSKRPTRCLL